MLLNYIRTIPNNLKEHATISKKYHLAFKILIAKITIIIICLLETSSTSTTESSVETTTVLVSIITDEGVTTTQKPIGN